MNKYDKLIIKILLKICRILSHYSDIKYIENMFYTTEKELEESEKNEKRD